MSRRNENIFEEKSHLGRKIGVTLLVVLLLTFGAGAVANFAISNTVKTLRQTVTIPDLPNSLDQWSILLLTDLNGEYRGLNQASIGKAVGTRAVSCVIMTGNMIGENGDAGAGAGAPGAASGGVEGAVPARQRRPVPLRDDGARLPFALCGLGAGAH